MKTVGANSSSSSSDLRELDALADLLDTKFRGPFGFRFGLDGLLGLIPGVGDAITSAMGGYIVLKAVWLGYPASVIALMLINFFVDALLDAIPLFGNIADFFFKSNTRNLKLMRSYALEPERTRRRSMVSVVLVLLIVLAAIVAAVAASVYVVVLIFQWLAAEGDGLGWQVLLQLVTATSHS